MWTGLISVNASQAARVFLLTVSASNMAAAGLQKQSKKERECDRGERDIKQEEGSEGESDSSGDGGKAER